MVVPDLRYYISLPYLSLMQFLPDYDDDLLYHIYISQHLEKGFFIEPTIITDVTTSMQIWREEVFGPVLCVKTFASEDEAIELANDSQ